ncbi:MAG: hypothetical protein GY788_28415 [bacterium]|nr:hypothetical protein [bacterium]
MTTLVRRLLIVGWVATTCALSATPAAATVRGYDGNSAADTFTTVQDVDNRAMPPGAELASDVGHAFDLPACSYATNTLDELAEFSGTLRDAARGKGNFGIGSATKADANLMGEAWVGPNYTIASDGRTLVSFDGLRQYRPPSYKPQLGTYQANLEQRLVPSGAWQSNAHLDITDLAVSQAP